MRLPQFGKALHSAPEVFWWYHSVYKEQAGKLCALPLCLSFVFEEPGLDRHLPGPVCHSSDPSSDKTPALTSKKDLNPECPLMGIVILCGGHC